MRGARETFSRRIRPPLVIKALLDMKGDVWGKAEPLTLGMLERLEGIVKATSPALEPRVLPPFAH